MRRKITRKPIRKQSVGIAPMSKNYAAGLAYIVIPSDTDRQKYITQCLRTNMVMIYTEYGQLYRQVRIGDYELQNLTFPDKSTELGSCVGFVTLPLQNKPIIVALYSSIETTMSTMDEDQLVIGRKSSTTRSQVVFDRKGALSITVKGGKGIGRCDVNIEDLKQAAQLNVRVKGSTSIDSHELLLRLRDLLSLTITDPLNGTAIAQFIYQLQQGLKFIDEFDNQIVTNKDGIGFMSNEKVYIGDIRKAQPLVLGDELTSLLDDLLAAISSITTATMLGAQPILNKVVFEKLKERVDSIKSVRGFSQ